MPMYPDWTQVRAAMLLDPSAIYLNTGSYGPLPRVVFERVTELRRRLAAEPSDFLWRQTPPLLWQARERLAQFVHADPHRLIFTVNVTAAINAVAASLRLSAPGEILMTTQEYGSMRYAWERAAQRQGLSLRQVPIPLLPAEPGELISTIVSQIRPETRLLFISHALHTTGMVMPVAAICGAARQHNILTVVDGAHAPGMIPVDLPALGCDFYGANCHKWLLAPIGAGFLYVAPGQEERLLPLIVSWGWHFDRAKADQRDEFGSTPWIRAFEFEGTRDPCPWLAVPRAIDFHESLGPPYIGERHGELTDYVREKLDGLKGLRLATPAQTELRGAITAFHLPSRDIRSVRNKLWQDYRLEVPVVEHPEGNLLRVSTHFYNTESEIDRLAEALAETLV